MIYDHLSRQAHYRACHSGFDQAFDYLSTFDRHAPTGRYPIDGERVYALVQEYTTLPREQRKFETHRRYIDLQYILSGREIIYAAPSDRLNPIGNYLEDTDYQLHDGEDNHGIIMEAGDFGVFFPHDGHKPGCSCRENLPVRKVVVKIRVRS